ncbi:hypothetical protein BCAR13_490024 [Paraburkholderia caribensis]|nr:hypothetical protein BCAR13_490024 [Paraburkholderia caribensis]
MAGAASLPLAAWRSAGDAVIDLAGRPVVSAAAAGRRRLSVEERVMFVMLAVGVRRFVRLILNDNHSHLQGFKTNRFDVSIGEGLRRQGPGGARDSVQLVRRIARADVLADEADRIDVRLAIRRFHDLFRLMCVRVDVLVRGWQARLVLEAQEELQFVGLLDGHRQRAADVIGRRADVVAHAFLRRKRDVVAHGCLAVVQLALHRAVRARQDRAAVEAHHEQLRLLRAQHEPFPQLFARQRFDERIERIVDLNEMFEVQDDSFLLKLKVHALSGNGQARADRDRIAQDLVHGACIGYLQESFLLFVRQIARQDNLPVDRRAVAIFLHRQRHAHFFERPAFTLCVHFQRNRRARAEARQQQGVRRRATIAAAQRLRFVGEPCVCAIVEQHLEIRRADVCGDLRVCHARSCAGR